METSRQVTQLESQIHDRMVVSESVNGSLVTLILQIDAKLEHSVATLCSDADTIRHAVTRSLSEFAVETGSMR